MSTSFRRTLAPALAAAVFLMLPLAARADEAFDVAVGLLKQATRYDPNSNYNALLRSLRQLKDPEMAPIFESLADSERSSLEIHGILGLAECKHEPRVNLARVVAIKDMGAQTLVITAAMDSSLLPLEDVQKLYDWKTIDIAVKTIVAASLVHAGKLPNLDLLHEAAAGKAVPANGNQPNPNAKEINFRLAARQAIANLLLLQMGDPDAHKGLDELSASKEASRDYLRDMVLATAIRFELDKIAPWAASVSQEPGVDRTLGLTALAVALRFGAPGAADIWRQRFESDNDMADRVRLGILAIRLAPWSDPKFYDPLIASGNPLLQRMGAAGQAVASKKEVAPAVIALIQMNHALSNDWALGLAKDRATPEDAREILKALVLAVSNGPPNGQLDLLDDAVNASEVLAEKDPAAAMDILHPLLADKKTDPMLVRAILLGLIRADGGKPEQIVAGLPPFEDRSISALALLLVAKHGQTLTQDQVQQLALCVRGGSMPDDGLRIQAAWTYLKITKQVQAALAQVLSK